MVVYVSMWICKWNKNKNINEKSFSTSFWAAIHISTVPDAFGDGGKYNPPWWGGVGCMIGQGGGLDGGEAKLARVRLQWDTRRHWTILHSPVRGVWWGRWWGLVVSSGGWWAFGIIVTFDVTFGCGSVGVHGHGYWVIWEWQVLWVQGSSDSHSAEWVLWKIRWNPSSSLPGQKSPKDGPYLRNWSSKWP